MSDPRQRTFFAAPQSLRSLTAAILEPLVVVLTLAVVMAWHGEPWRRPEWVLTLLAVALTFPGRDRFLSHPVSAAVDIVSTWGLVAGLLGVFALATDSLRYFNTDVLWIWALATPVAQGLAFALGRTTLHRLAARPGARRKAVIVGAGRLGVKLAAALQQDPMRHTEVLGYFDDRHDDRIDPEAHMRWLGPLDDLSEQLGARGVHEVYITLPLSSQPRWLLLMDMLQDSTASVYFVPDVVGISIIQGRLLDVNGVPAVGLLETPFTGTNALVKRAVDVVLSGIILVLTAPLLALLAVGVKLGSAGPVLFKQARTGLDGQVFTVYKFRSMLVAANSDGEVVQATRGDPRITRLGALMRRTSLDELPQFINVLQGRMSIVGPRPHAVAHNEAYRQLIKTYMVRHKVRPGITGWAQVNGLRGETDTLDKMRMRVEYDLFYLRNWSVGLDLQIILRTVRLVLFDRQAY